MIWIYGNMTRSRGSDHCCVCQRLFGTPTNVSPFHGEEDL